MSSSTAGADEGDAEQVAVVLVDEHAGAAGAAVGVQAGPEHRLAGVDGAETRCGEPAAQAIPEALSGLYPGVRNSSWSCRRRKPVLPPSMTG